MKQFIFPDMERGEQVCAVYKMIFDDGSYYVGSSLNLRQRINGWKFKLASGVDKNYKVTDAYKRSEKVVFEILEVVDDPIMRKFREDGYIKINFGKPLCLNIAPSSTSNFGITMNPNRKVNKSHYKPVAKIDDNGNIVERYECVREANEKNHTMDVGECFKNSLRKVKGMVFRELDADGNIVPAPLIPFKGRKSRKKGYKVSESAKEVMRIRRIERKNSPNYIPPKLPPHTKKIFQYNEIGVLIKEYSSISGAAKEFNCDSKNFKKQIKRSPRNYYKGFIWKYA